MQGPYKLEIDQLLWYCQEAPPTLLRNQTLIVNPGFWLGDKSDNSISNDQSAGAAENL